MKFLWREMLEEEAGYTLVETLVALSLFLSVLIPLGVAIGTLLLDKEAEKISQALLIAEREMTTVCREKDLESRQFEDDRGYAVKREVVENRGMREIQIAVSHCTKPAKVLVSLHKTLVQMP